MKVENELSAQDGRARRQQRRKLGELENAS
jgi:hypothetical protein